MNEDQGDLFDPHAHTRRSDPDTSHLAAAMVNKNISESCAFVRQAMRLLGPSCDEDLQNFYNMIRLERGWPPQRCVRKRRKDLVDAGFARWTGRRVLNPVGRPCYEWELCDA